MLFQFTNANSQKGFTLLESLLACFLSSLVVLLCYFLFLVYYKTHQVESKQLDFQEKTRFIHAFLSHEIQSPSFKFCQNKQNHASIHISADAHGNSVIGIRSIDLLYAVTHQGSDERSLILGMLKPVFKRGDRILLTDGNQCFVKIVTQSQSKFSFMQQIVTLDEITPIYKKIMAFKVENKKIYIDKSRESKGSALFLEDENKRHIEITDGVESMQVDVFLHQSWQNFLVVQDWLDVKALKITLKLLDFGKSMYIFVPLEIEVE